MLSFIAIHPLHQNNGFGHYLIAAIHTLLDEFPDTEGVTVYATNEKYKAFFRYVDYQLIEEVNVGKVSGSLMVHYRDKKSLD